MNTINLKNILVLLILTSLALGACASDAGSGDLTFTDALGREVTLDGPAQRVISLAPSTTEVLFAVGAGGQVVGRDSFSDYPPEALALADIGGGFGELNTELILSLEPDLVVAALITPSEQIQALEGLGLKVFVLPNPSSFEGLYELLETAGRLTGHEGEASFLNTELSARVIAVTEAVSDVEKPVVFYELDATDPNAPYTSGPGTFVDMVISGAGGQNLGASLTGEWVQISVEALLTEDPDIILLGDALWGGVTPEAVAARAGWDGLTAVIENRVFPFDDNLVSRPGPRLVDGLEEMAKLLHPELFK